MHLPNKRSALQVVTKKRLRVLMESFGLELAAANSKAAHIDLLARSEKVTLPKLLEHLQPGELKNICLAHGLYDGGHERSALIARLLTEPTKPTLDPTGLGAEGSEKVRILLFAANPSDLPRIRTDREVKAIQSEMESSPYNDRFELLAQWAVQPHEIAPRIARTRPALVQFSGHGERGELVFEDERGAAVIVSTARLAKLFNSEMAHGIRCVFLNACFTKPLAEALLGHVECVVGVDGQITDDEALEVARSFYAAIFAGHSIAAAASRASSALHRVEALHVLARRDADPSKIVLLHLDGEAAPQPARRRILLGSMVPPIKGYAAFVPSDRAGTPGLLNQSVLELRGYPRDALRSLAPQLQEQGWGMLQAGEEDPVWAVVSVSMEPSDRNIRKNLPPALIHAVASGSYRLWLPLMGLGAGNLDPMTSATATFDSLRSLPTNVEIDVVVSAPQGAYEVLSLLGGEFARSAGWELGTWTDSSASASFPIEERPLEQELGPEGMMRTPVAEVISQMASTSPGGTPNPSTGASPRSTKPSMAVNPSIDPSPASERAMDENSRLHFPEDWRFDASLTQEVPYALCQDLYDLVKTIAKSANKEWPIVALFQERFGEGGSSSLSFAYGDLESAMKHRTANGALFIEYFWRGVCDARRAGAAVPSIENLNTLFRKHQFPYELAPPELRRTGIPTASRPSHRTQSAVAPDFDKLPAPAAPARDEQSAPEANEWTDILDSAGSASDVAPALDVPDADELLAPTDPAYATAPLPAASISPLVIPANTPRSAETHTSASLDSRTVTLTITATNVRLDRGLQIAAGSVPVWSRDMLLDWSQEHFFDEDCRYTLDQAIERLPLQWSRRLVEQFGQTLSRLIFGDPIPAEVLGTLLLPSGDTGRLILVLDAEQQRVPWEYLRIEAHFLAEQQLSIVRHVETISTPMPLVIEKPRTILFAYANPGIDEAAKYDGDAHKKKILDALSTFRATVMPAELCTAAGLEKLLCTGDGQVFHFLGHGVAGGTWEDAGLVVHGEPDGQERCPAEKIGLWMRDRRRSLAVLGACYGAAVPRAGLLSSVGGRIVHTSGTPVVAMQMEVPQAFSTAFVERFYRELPAAGFNIEISVFLARRAQCEERHLFGIPVLLADARGLDKVPDLRSPPGESPHWAQFAPVAALTSQDAVAAWGDLPANIARAAVAAIRKNAESDPAARYPQPSDDLSQLFGRVAELRHAIRDPEARSSLAVASAAAPTTEPFAFTSGVIEPLDELPLAHRLTVERCQAALKRVHADFSLPDGLVARIVGELRAGKHVMLTGPVGTGKTSIAQAVVRALGYDFHLDTASADWTRFEILGGFMPTPREGSRELHFTFRPGVFLEAVRANWSAEPTPGSARVARWRRVRRPNGKEGMWLILDELNRADMDRALGGIFTALETRNLRVPTSDPDGGTVEIPIPEDFRVIATINAADRHFLFRLSDALKRRFAFVHVPVTIDWDGEWTRLRREARIPDETNADDLRRFVALVRMFHPLGSALVLAALRLYGTSDFHVTEDPEWPLAQAIEGALLPNLEDLSHASLVALHTWSQPAPSDRLAQSLLVALSQPSAVEPERLAALAALPRQLSPQYHDGDESPPAPDDLELVAAWIARRVARAPDAAKLPRLSRALLDLIRHAPHA